MQEVSISVDIFSAWREIPHAYRIYIDNDLLTERTYIWNNSEQFIKEHIIVNLEPGIHKLRLESVDPKFKGFTVGYMAVDNKMPTRYSDNQFVVE